MIDHLGGLNRRRSLFNVLKKLLSGWAILAMVLTFSGCNGDRVGLADFAAEHNKLNIQKINNAYLLMAAKNDFRGPASETAFRDFLANDQRVTDNLEFMGIDRSELDQYFVGRDGERLTIRYGLSGLDPSSSAPLVFESSGVDGIRQVGFSNWTIKEIDEEEFKRLLKSKRK